MFNPDWKKRIGLSELYANLMTEKSVIINSKYRIVKEIGRGGFSRVYLVQDETDKIEYIIYRGGNGTHKVVI
jgi:serine/threonine protein kinase